ncbi:uncharacterized protein BO97DRAFT_426398 [Aspergillus homomorphus CBS 101889]|uniref:Uncharacterized protein n=1 Tax=Aspergillus homomorphus (strain CBS 101889) TaxID=1450537 RepID=A0A395HRR9_ASPHC|nr:hypothetical protein BO97DRAFT_426398 [Aspergillus homomorphus CBS 101889]RAL10632.1 hypothetical protein BO97DRAFT_426398 [Aspergillus homomorphus CBS 101889]
MKTLFKNATIIPGFNPPPPESPTCMIIEDDSIVFVRTESNLPIELFDREIVLAGKKVLPGFIDGSGAGSCCAATAPSLDPDLQTHASTTIRRLLVQNRERLLDAVVGETWLGGQRVH